MGIDLISSIQPKNAGDFPTHEAIYGKGGFLAVADATARDAITTLRRVEGMHVFVISVALVYRLGAGLSNSDWIVAAGAVGVGTQAMANANQTPNAGVLANGTIKTTGALTAQKQLILPAFVDGTAKIWVIDNECTGAYSLKVWDGGAGTFVVVPNGRIASVLMDSRGATAVGGIPSPGGTTGSIQLNDGAGGYTGATDFTWDETNKRLLIGNGATVSGNNATGIGRSCVSSGTDSIALGYLATASQTYAISIGGTTTSSGAGSVCIGEVSTSSGDNANCIGYASTASAIYSNVFGSYCTASATGALACGISASAVRAGEMAHGSGITGIGDHQMDLAIEAATGAESLVDAAGLPFTAAALVHCKMRVELTGVTRNGAKQAGEVRELLFWTSSSVLTLVSETVISTLGGSFAAAGWVCAISANGYDLKLDINCRPGTDAVKFNARISWSEIVHNAIAATGTYDPGGLAWSYWMRDYDALNGASREYGKASAGTSAANFLTQASATQGAALNGHGTCDVVPSQYLFNNTVPLEPDLITKSAYTVSCLVYVRNLTADAGVYADKVIVGNAGGDWGIAMSSDGAAGGPGVAGWHYDSVGRKETGWKAMTANAWHRVDFKYDGSNCMIRVDGGAWATSPACTDLNITGGVLYVGRNSGAAYSDMKIAELMISKVAISDGNLDSIRTSYQLARFGV